MGTAWRAVPTSRFERFHFHRSSPWAAEDMERERRWFTANCAISLSSSPGVSPSVRPVASVRPGITCAGLTVWATLTGKNTTST